MIIAKGTVIVGDKTYHSGETIEGLPAGDIPWMVSGGYIEVKEDAPAKAKSKKAKDKEPDGSEKSTEEN